jgi:AcrR family transcriptional regulator
MKRAPQDLRRRKGAATRERIVEAAIELFSSQGYAASGVSEIARRARIEKAALYWHFESKEELLAEVIERIDAGWIEEIQKQIAEVREPWERLERFVAGLRRLVAGQSHLLRLMMNVALERSEVSPESRHAVRRILDRTVAVITDEFEKSLGVPLPDADLIARLSLGSLFEATLRSAVDPDHLDLDRAFRYLRRLIALDVGVQLQRLGAEPPERTSLPAAGRRDGAGRPERPPARKRRPRRRG